MQLKLATSIPPHASFLQDSQDLDFLQEYLGIKFSVEYGSITGAFVVVGEGDYDEIYVTFSSRPYLTSSMYYLVEM